MHHLWIHISWWPLCWQLLQKGKQIVLLQNGAGGGGESLFTFTHSCLQNFQLLTQVWSIWRARWKGDWWNTFALHKVPALYFNRCFDGHIRGGQQKWNELWLGWSLSTEPLAYNPSYLHWSGAGKIYKATRIWMSWSLETLSCKMLPLPQR